MTSRDSNELLNHAIRAMAHSFLQYMAEGWPWVRSEVRSAEQQIRVLAARQRQDVSELAEFLSERDVPIDFGTFPTQYTDQQFLSLTTIITQLTSSHRRVCEIIDEATAGVRAAGDAEGAEVLSIVSAHEHDIATALNELAQELSSPVEQPTAGSAS